MVNLPNKTGDPNLDYTLYEITQAINSGAAGAASGFTGASLTYDMETGEIEAGEIFVGWLYRYLDTAYGTSVGGDNFSENLDDLAVGTDIWQGVRNSDSADQSTTAAEFLWRRVNTGEITEVVSLPAAGTGGQVVFLTGTGYHQYNSATGWTRFRPYYNVLGGGRVDWVFSGIQPANYVLDDGSTAVDLSSAVSGPPGPRGLQ